MHVRSADCARFECEWVWVSADVIVGGDGGAAVVAERVALPAVNDLVERHLVRVRVGDRIRARAKVRVRVRVRGRGRVRVR